MADDDDTVVKLVARGEQWKAAVQDDIIGRLEMMLEHAKAGRLDGIIVIGREPGGGNITTFSRSLDRMWMAGIVQYVLYRFLKAYDEDEDDP
jgi:hypothetical protein